MVGCYLARTGGELDRILGIYAALYGMYLWFVIATADRHARSYFDLFFDKIVADNLFSNTMLSTVTAVWGSARRVRNRPILQRKQRVNDTRSDPHWMLEFFRVVP